MKKILLILFAATFSLWHFETIAKYETTDIALEAEEPDRSVDPSKGRRIPAAPVICTIDFKNHRIATSIPYAITAYELWDEEGESLIVSYTNDYDMVQYMANTTGVFRLRLTTDGRTYLGYLEL